jgi:hypothetical protein
MGNKREGVKKLINQVSSCKDWVSLIASLQFYRGEEKEQTAIEAVDG